MTESRIIYESLRQQKGRTLLLLLTIAIAFLVYGVLGALRYSFNSGADEVAQGRLIVTNQQGLMEPLPMAYRARIRSVPGVGAVGHATWFGAYFQTQKQMLMAFAVDPATWLAQHPDMELSPEAARSFLDARDGMLVAEQLARRYNWTVGSVVPLKSILFAPANGERFWSFRVSGLFRSTESGGGRNYIIMHYDYLNENRNVWRNTVGTFMVTPKQGTRIEDLAAAIDAQFATSRTRTASATDRAFHAEFFAQFGNVAMFIRAIVLVSFVSMIFVVASTLTVTIRQRTRDIGVLKTLGFSDPRILRLVYAETLALMFAGGAVGLIIAATAIAVLAARLPTFVPDIGLPGRVIAEAAAIMLAIGLVAGSLPALLALRMRPIAAFAGDA